MTLFWLAGFTLGALLYFVGYGRLWLELGGLSEIFNTVSGLNVTGNSVELYDRPYLLLQNAIASFSGNYQYGIIFSEASPTIHGLVRFIVMVSISLMAILVVAVRKRFYAPLGYLLLLITSFIVVSLYFAGHFAPHHMIPMLPFLYIVLGVSLHLQR